MAVASKSVECPTCGANWTCYGESNDDRCSRCRLADERAQWEAFTAERADLTWQCGVRSSRYVSNGTHTVRVSNHHAVHIRSCAVSAGLIVADTRAATMIAAGRVAVRMLDSSDFSTIQTPYPYNRWA